MPAKSFTPLLGLITGQICLHASMAGFRMGAPLAVLRSGLGQWRVGPLLALFALAPVVLAIPAGRLADRRGYHLPVRIAVALTAVGGGVALISGFSGQLEYPLLCLAAMACGAGANIGLITIQRTAGRTAAGPLELRRVFSWLGVAPSISNFVGPLTTGLMIDHFGFHAAFALLSVVPFAALLVSRSIPREPARAAAAVQSPRGAWDLLASPMLRRLLAVNWFMSTSWDVHSFVVPVLGHERQLSASAIGSILGTFALAVTGIRLVLPLVAHRLRESQVLVTAMLVVAFVFAIYPWAASVWTMSACAILLGFALGSSQPMVMTALHQVTPEARHGEAIALRSMALNLSSTLMPLAFGVLGTALGAAGLFWFMGALVFGGTFVARTIRSS